MQMKATGLELEGQHVAPRGNLARNIRELDPSMN
jgi:hypothetical protein